VAVPLGRRRYTIRIAGGLLDRVGPEILSVHEGGPAFLLSDTRVHSLYGPRVERSLREAGFRVGRFLIPPGERAKTLATVRRIYDALLAWGADRSTVVVALGGGVVGDTAGFAAATWHRGLPFVQIPTTLLAQVDASVGGKTGVDLPGGKNLVGAFHQPLLVIADPGALTTLGDREYRAGIAEVVKYGMIRDATFLSFLAREAEAVLRREEGPLVRIIERCCRIKAAYVVLDEEDRTGKRAELNYGHTFGHAIESATGYRRYLHGEAVALGMTAASRVAVAVGCMTPGERESLLGLLRRYRLPTGGVPADPEAVFRLLARDKKSRGGRLRIVLTKGIGLATVHESVPDPLLRGAIREVCGHLPEDRVRASDRR
jgi:3-dehydroquinate synthase